MYAAYLRGRRRRRVAIAAAQGLILLTTLALWELAAARFWVNPMLTSRPSAVLATLVRLGSTGALQRHLLTTLVETLAGFAIGMALGLGVAAALWWWPALAEVLDPYLVVLNALPKIALGPIFYIWLGDRWSVYGMAVAISIIVTIVMLHAGFHEVEPNQILVMRTFGASRGQILRRVILPASLPTLMATLKVNIGLTLVGVIVGEFLSAKAGLGYLIIYGGQVFQMELVMTSIVILAAISAALYLAVTWLERLVTRLLHLPIRS
ncbi:MAG: ABC transporter permease [Bacillota bacterium]